MSGNVEPSTHGRHGDAIMAALAAARAGPSSIWITLCDERVLARRAAALDALPASACDSLPLIGWTFGVKDNIDVAGLPTTAGCPAFAYEPQRSARVVERLERAGATCIGKTNLDQFATGLVGTRSPYGAVANPFDDRYVAGGSSSGSAAAVAHGQVTFALGTDTAGSGRVPAGFTGTIGVKPTRGWLPTTGIVPACRSLDCVSVFGGTLDHAWRPVVVAAGVDAEDAGSRPVRTRAPFASLRLAVPQPLEFCGDAIAARHFARTLDAWRSLGATLVDIPYSPLGEAAALLYDGPFVAERTAAVGEFIAAHPDACDPVVRDIILGGRRYDAAAAWRAEYRRRDLAAAMARRFDAFDALLVPTAPTLPTLAALRAAPVAVNAALGHYANFVNLLDLCAIALPAGRRDDGPAAGFTLIGQAGSDHALALLAHGWLAAHPQPRAVGRAPEAPRAPPVAPADGGTITLAVVGAHLRGMPLHHELVAVDARFAGEARTSARYALYALGGVPPKPGLVRRAGEGAAIALELFDIPRSRFGEFIALVPGPLAIGTVELDDGRLVKGFVCEPVAIADALDITHHGGWRSFQASRHPLVPAT